MVLQEGHPKPFWVAFLELASIHRVCLGGRIAWMVVADLVRERVALLPEGRGEDRQIPQRLGVILAVGLEGILEERTP